MYLIGYAKVTVFSFQYFSSFYERSARNPQIRYSQSNLSGGYDLSVGMEYIIPNLAIPDSIGAKIFQLIPALSVRLDKVFSWGFRS